MEFISVTKKLRDLSPHTGVLDYVRFSRPITCFVADPDGKIHLFEETLPVLSGIPISHLPEMSVHAMRQTLEQTFGTQAVEADSSGHLYSRKHFRHKHKNHVLVWTGFPLGTRPHPSGIYFLIAYDRLPPESEIQKIDLPAVAQLKEKIEKAAIWHALDNADRTILEEQVTRLMEIEPETCQKHRVFLSNGITVHDGHKPVFLKFEKHDGNLHLTQESPLHGDVLFFQNLLEGGGRPAMLRHTDRLYDYEIFLPLSWHAHIIGWIGVPLPSLETWMHEERVKVEAIVRDTGQLMGEDRMALGLLPKYEVQDGLFEFESFMTLLDSLIHRHLPSPFVLLMVRGTPESMADLRDVLNRSRRAVDVLTQTGEELVLLFPYQEPSKAPAIEKRYKNLLEHLLAAKTGLIATLFVYAWNGAPYSSEEILNKLLLCMPVEIAPVAEKPSDPPQRNFDDWLKRFLILKDWE